MTTIYIIFKNGKYFGEKESDQKLIKELTNQDFLSRIDLEKFKEISCQNGYRSICISHPMPEYKPIKKYEYSNIRKF